jgi:hypothetical protein
MKSTYLLALAMLAVLVFAGAAYADQNDYNYGYSNNHQTNQNCQTCPAATGAGPSCAWPNCPNTPSPNVCNVTPTGQCGAFCAAGQQAPGWPYNWCSEYWLRPDSNF